VLGADACGHPGGGEEGYGDFVLQVHLREWDSFMVLDTTIFQLSQ